MDEYKSWKDDWKPLNSPILTDEHLLIYPSNLGFDNTDRQQYILNCVYPEHLEKCLRLPGAFPVIE